MIGAPPLAAEIFAGYVGGSAKVLAFYPLDTITTLREVGVQRSTSRRPLVQYYAGCGLTLLAALPFAVVFHTALWLCERMLHQILPVAVLRLVASTAGAVAASLVGVPFECLKHRIQLGVRGYATPRQALASTLRGEGTRGLYTGLSSTLARNVPYNALHFGIFELASSALRGAVLPARTRDILAGALSGAITALLTTPLDLVNTRLQTQAMLAADESGGADGRDVTLYAGPVDALSTILAQGGVPELMQGAGVRVVQYAPSAVVFFVVYEAIKRRLSTG